MHGFGMDLGCSWAICCQTISVWSICRGLKGSWSLADNTSQCQSTRILYLNQFIFTLNSRTGCWTHAFSQCVSSLYTKHTMTGALACNGGWLKRTRSSQPRRRKRRKRRRRAYLCLWPPGRWGGRGWWGSSSCPWRCRPRGCYRSPSVFAAAAAASTASPAY